MLEISAFESFESMLSCSALVIAALFDREVNCRRAASVSETFSN